MVYNKWFLRNSLLKIRDATWRYKRPNATKYATSQNDKSGTLFWFLDFFSWRQKCYKKLFFSIFWRQFRYTKLFYDDSPATLFINVHFSTFYSCHSLADEANATKLFLLPTFIEVTFNLFSANFVFLNHLLGECRSLANVDGRYNA